MRMALFAQTRSMHMVNIGILKPAPIHNIFRFLAPFYRFFTILRGCVSKLSLLMEYVGFLTKWKGIKSADEMNKFSKRERDYIKAYP